MGNVARYFEVLKTKPKVHPMIKVKRWLTEKYRKQRKAWRERNPKKLHEMRVRHYQKHKLKRCREACEWQRKNRCKANAKNRKWEIKNRIKLNLKRKIQRENLCDHYVKKQIVGRSKILGCGDIPKSLIEIKRIILTFKRYERAKKHN